MTDSSDGSVVRAVLAGDREAFGILVERHQDRLLAYVRHMGFGEAESLDLVQDGFVRAFRHLRRCGDPDRFDGWVFRIVSNLCRTAGRRKQKRRTEPIEDHRATLRSPGPGPEEQMEASMVREHVRQALGTVPDDQREALVLMYLHGHSVREIADLTGASASAVKMRLMRGRDALKEELEPLLTGTEES